MTRRTICARACANCRASARERAAAIVARRLRERGARGVQLGPRAATRANPAGLTARQLDVLALLTRGDRNAEIAAKLFLSEKTVDHHVSAILRKLGGAHAAARRPPRPPASASPKDREDLPKLRLGSARSVVDVNDEGGAA